MSAVYIMIWCAPAAPLPLRQWGETSLGWAKLAGKSAAAALLEADPRVAAALE